MKGDESINYPRAKTFPGPGFSAGPCLFRTRCSSPPTRAIKFALGHAAMHVNEGLVLQLVDDCGTPMTYRKMTVGLLGMASRRRSTIRARR